MKKNKVCHIISIHKRYDIRVLRKECVSLARKGYDVTLLTSDGLYTEIVDGVKIKSVDIMRGVWWLKQGLWMVDGKKKKSKDVSLLNRIRRELCTHKHMLKDALSVNAEIYHIHEPSLLSLGLKLKKQGKKVIYDSHEDDTAVILDMDFIPKLLRPLISQFYKLYYNSRIKKMDSLITVTPHIVRKLKKINKNTELISNFPILIKNQKFPKEKTVPNMFGFAGGIKTQWNHETVMKVLNEIDAKYELMGVISDEFLQKLMEYESWHKVNFRGHVPHEEAVMNLSRCVACIAIYDYSNNTDGRLGTLGNTKLFEYMMLGKPVICTDFFLWKKIIDKWQCGIYIPPRDVNMLKNAMLYLMNNPQKAKKMGDNGRQAVIEEFNWSIGEEKLLKIYERLS